MVVAQRYELGGCEFESHLRCLFFLFVCFLKNKVFKYFSTSFPCKVKLSFYPNNYLSFTEIYSTVIALRHVRQ